MKVTDKRVKYGFTFEELEVGDVFLDISNIVYIKIASCEAFDTSRNNIVAIGSAFMVQKVDAELVINGVYTF